MKPRKYAVPSRPSAIEEKDSMFARTGTRVPCNPLPMSRIETLSRSADTGASAVVNCGCGRSPLTLALVMFCSDTGISVASGRRSLADARRLIFARGCSWGQLGTTQRGDTSFAGLLPQEFADGDALVQAREPVQNRRSPRRDQSTRSRPWRRRQAARGPNLVLFRRGIDETPAAPQRRPPAPGGGHGRHERRASPHVHLSTFQALPWRYRAR